MLCLLIPYSREPQISFCTIAIVLPFVKYIAFSDSLLSLSNMRLKSPHVFSCYRVNRLQFVSEGEEKLRKFKDRKKKDG